MSTPNSLRFFIRTVDAKLTEILQLTEILHQNGDGLIALGRKCDGLRCLVLGAIWRIGNALALAPCRPREAEATALIEASATRQANTGLLLNRLASLIGEAAGLEEATTRALLARVDKGAAPSHLLTGRLVLDRICAAGAVRTRLGRVKLRRVEGGLLVPAERLRGRHTDSRRYA